jgi:beta-aspartyl-dipeptidase (metallo-type)
MILLLEGGDVYTPEHVGRADVLVVDSKIVHVGSLDRRALDKLGVPYEVIDASRHIITAGFIDPHEIRIAEILPGGITTVVGCLGVDTTMKNMPGLLARSKALKEEGLSAYVWSGGYNIPPSTITGSLRGDILFVDEVIGAGEIAISDERAMEASPAELARLVSDCQVGGRLAKFRTVIEEHDVKPEWMYPTHTQRNEKLMDEAIQLARSGMVVDIDVVDRDLFKWLRYYRDHDGPFNRLTVSTDAAKSSPRYLLDQIRRCIRDHQLPMEEVLPLVTSNTAEILKLRNKGRVEKGMDADLLLFEKDGLELTDLIAMGQRRIKDGTLTIREQALKTDRDIFVGR